MTLQQFIDTVAACELRNFPLRLRVTASEATIPVAGVRVVAVMAVRDRDSGHEVEVAVSLTIDWYRVSRMEREDVVDAVRTLLLEAVTHEFNEAWHVDGQRVNDPHRHE